MILQFCGLSGAGKSTLAKAVSKKLLRYNIRTEIIDGDDYRSQLCRDLGFSREDREENIRRLGFVASKLALHGIVPIMSAINPYDAIRKELANKYDDVKTIFIDCPLPTLLERDTKDLYRRALLPNGHADKVHNLTGISDPFEAPHRPDLYINTQQHSILQCTEQICNYVLEQRAEATTILNSRILYSTAV